MAKKLTVGKKIGNASNLDKAALEVGSSGSSFDKVKSEVKKMPVQRKTAAAKSNERTEEKPQKITKSKPQKSPGEKKSVPGSPVSHKPEEGEYWFETINGGVFLCRQGGYKRLILSFSQYNYFAPPPPGFDEYMEKLKKITEKYFKEELNKPE